MADTCGNVIDEVEERFNAFIAHERKEYRARLQRELAEYVQQRGMAQGRKDLPSKAQGSGPQAADRSSQECVFEGVLGSEEVDQPGPSDDNGKCGKRGRNGPSEPSSGIYSPSRNSDHMDEGTAHGADGWGLQPLVIQNEGSWRTKDESRKDKKNACC